MRCRSLEQQRRHAPTDEDQDGKKYTSRSQRASIRRRKAEIRWEPSHQEANIDALMRQFLRPQRPAKDGYQSAPLPAARRSVG
jgi:hypothetical protein